MATVRLFSGGLTKIDAEGQWTGIHKQAISGPVQLTVDGLTGDMQADRRVHGGPEKALHYYAAENYRQLAERFPGVAEQFVPGSIGENVSANGFDEWYVSIGDIFRLGGSLLQVSQPRSPCWKIDYRYGRDGVARTIAETGLTGWYYRVLEPGMLSAGDALELVDRLPGAVSLAALWQVWREHRPHPARVEELSGAPGLTADWRRKLIERARWLRRHGGERAER